MFNKKYKVIILEVFLIVLGIIGLTLGINYITNVNIGTSSLAIDDMNASVSTGNLSPVEDSSINVNTTSNVLRITFEVKGASTNKKSNIIYDVALNLSADCILKNENVKWNLYKNNNLLTTGNISPSFDEDILEDKLILTNTQEDLPTYSSTSDKYVFILWMSESCTEEDITKCDLSKALSSNMGNKTISGNIDIRLNTGKKKPHTRVSSDTNSCTILRGNGASAVMLADDGTSGDNGSGVYKVHHDEIGADISVTGEVIPAVDDYRYYGANPNNYIQLPDMNTEEKLYCVVDGYRLVESPIDGTFPSTCDKEGIYKFDYGDGEEHYYPASMVNIIAPAGSMTWVESDEVCIYGDYQNADYYDTYYNDEVDENICSQFSLVNIEPYEKYSRMDIFGAIISKVDGKAKQQKYTNGLYRIIGSIYDELTGENRLKLIKATALTDGTVDMFAWNYKSDGTSDNIWATPTGTRNNITNNYSNSTTSGSSLMIMLNSGIWWSDTTNTGKMYDRDNESGRDVDFTNYKLSSTAKNLIGDSRYYLAGHVSTFITTEEMYQYERTKTGYKNGRYNDSRPYYWEGKVALMYSSDYGYAAGTTCVNGTNLYYYDRGCKNNDWLFIRNYQRSLSTDPEFGTGAWCVTSSGSVLANDFTSIKISLEVRPVFYLTSDVIIVSGTGTMDNPYQVTEE